MNLIFTGEWVEPEKELPRAMGDPHQEVHAVLQHHSRPRCQKKKKLHSWSGSKICDVGICASTDFNSKLVERLSNSRIFINDFIFYGERQENVIRMGLIPSIYSIYFPDKRVSDSTRQKAQRFQGFYSQGKFMLVSVSYCLFISRVLRPRLVHVESISLFLFLSPYYFSLRMSLDIVVAVQLRSLPIS